MSGSVSDSLLDAVLIIKDEEQHLPRCLEALVRLKSVIGEICIYDTGSTDDSIAICESFGARVQRGYWDHDFARARNAASSMSRASWLLHVDADEVIAADAARLRDTLKRETGRLDVLFFAIRSWNEGHLIGDAYVGRLVRRETTRFVGRIHEHAAPVRDGATIHSAPLPADLLLMSHAGYSGDGTIARKSTRNVAISEFEVEACRRPGVPESELHLALVHRARANFALGRLDAVERDLTEVRSLPSNLPTRRYAGEQLIELALRREDYAAAVLLLEQLSAEGSDSQWVRWRLASIAFSQGDTVVAWKLMKTVDAVVGGLGETVPPSKILEDRARLGLAAGDFDDAVATCLLLVGTHGRTDLVNVLLAAWEGWPPRLMARLLSEQGRAFAPQIVSALRQEGPLGVEVGGHYEALVSDIPEPQVAFPAHARPKDAVG